MGTREKSIRPFIAALLGVASVALIALVPAPPASASIEFVTEWGGGTTGSQFRRPIDVAADASGDVYVVDQNANQVKKFTEEGTFIQSWGSFGNGPGELDLPASIAVHRSSGTVYVADTVNSRIQSFTEEGQFIGQWETRDSFGNPKYPSGVAVDQASGNVYVLSSIDREVLRFSPTGTLLGKWGSYGTGDGQFEFPWSIDVFGSGDVYVTDVGTKSVQRFDSDGTFLTRFGSPGVGPGQFDFPAGVTEGPDGRVFVTDANLRKVSIFTAAGEYEARWGEFGGQISPFGIASLPSGELVVTETAYAPYQPGVTRFQPDGTAINHWGSAPNENGQLFEPKGVTASPAGGIYVSDNGNARIQEFTPGGAFIRKWNRAGRGPIDPAGITTDRNGNVHVADFGFGRILVYSPSGTFLRSWGKLGDAPGELFYPLDLAVDPAGNYYVIDNRDRVQKFTSAGKFIESWGSSGSADGQFNRPEGITLDSSGDVYVADFYNDRVQKFTPSGTFLDSFGSEDGEADISGAADVAVGLDGTVYALAYYGARVVRFGPDGTFISSWGSRGGGEGQFMTPDALAAAPSTAGTEVYVTDVQDGRLQRFLDTDGPKSAASLSRLTVAGPTKAKRGRPVTFTVGLFNSGALAASGVRLKGSGGGVSVSSPVGSVLPGVKRKVEVRVRFARKGKVTLRFSATSANAGTARATKTVQVR